MWRFARVGVGWVLVLMAAAAPGKQPVSQEVAAEVQRQFSVIDREAARLRQTGAAADADKLAARLRYFRDRLDGKAGPEGNDPELHVVGLYEGVYPDGVRRQANVHPVGSARVEIHPTGRPVVLALCSYEPVKWRVEVDKGVDLRKVILSGVYDQQAEGLPAGAAVENYSGGDGGQNCFFAHSRDEGYLSAARALKRLTGLNVATFQATYAFKGQPFVLGAQNGNWEARRLLAEMRPVFLAAEEFERRREREAVAVMRFRAVHFSPSQDPRFRGPGAELRADAAAANFTPLGPVAGTLHPLGHLLKHVAADPQTGVYYAISQHSVLRIDPATGERTEMKVDAGLPELSWPCGLTFDAKRGRLVLASLGGVGYLYAFEPATQKWSLLAGLDNVDLAALAYAAEEDCYYGLAETHGGTRLWAVYRFDAEGKPAGVAPLSERLPLLSGPLSSVQLAAAGRTLALITPPVPNVDEPAAPNAALCYLLNPRSGRVSYRGPIEDLPAPAPRPAPLAERELSALWAALGGPEDDAAERAMWKLASGGAGAVQFLRAKLPPAAAPAAARVRELVAALGGDDARGRDDASAELRRAGPAAEAELRRALKGDDLLPESRARVEAVLRDLGTPPAAGPGAEADEKPQWKDDPRLRRDRRAIDVLGRIDTAEAVNLLRELAAGTDGSPRTVHARAVLARLPASRAP